MRDKIKDLNLALSQDPPYHFNIQKNENIKFLTPLYMK